MQAIVVTFDRLATRLIGCYGNEWIETPNLDRLATNATVFDNHFADSVGPNSGKSWLTGRHPMRPVGASPTPMLGDVLRGAGVKSHFAGTGSVQNPWNAAGFDHVEWMTSHEGLDSTPADVPIAKLVQAGCKLLGDHTPENRLIWLHAPEPHWPPEGFASLYFDDFEERGFKQEDIPREDWSRQISVAAGYLSLIDHWLGELIAQVTAENNDQPTLLLITSARGKSWTEDFFAAVPSAQSHSPADLLRDHETRSPLLLRVHNDERFAELSGLRCQRLTEPGDVFATLLDWFGIATEPDQFEGASLLKQAVAEVPGRTELYFGDDDRTYGIRTAKWSCLMRVASSDQLLSTTIQFGDSDWPERVQLFSKPEDIWDVTDLATQYPADCESFVREVNGYRVGKK